MSAFDRFLDTLSIAAQVLALAAAKHWRRRTTFLHSRETVLREKSRDGRVRYHLTGHTRRMKDGTSRTYSALRRFPPKVKGKAAAKAAKRARQRAREIA